MAAIDYGAIPESTRQSLLAAAYKMVSAMMQDEELCAEIESRLAKRKAAQQAAK